MGQSPVPGSAAAVCGMNDDPIRSKKMNAAEAMVILVLFMALN